MDCFGAYFTHVPTSDNVRVQSATQWTASAHTLHMSNPKNPILKKINLKIEILKLSSFQEEHRSPNSVSAKYCNGKNSEIIFRIILNLFLEKYCDFVNKKHIYIQGTFTCCFSWEL